MIQEGRGEKKKVIQKKLALKKSIKTINQQGTNLPKDVQNLYLEKYEVSLREIKEDRNKWKVYLVHGLEDSIL